MIDGNMDSIINNKSVLHNIGDKIIQNTQNIIDNGLDTTKQLIKQNEQTNHDLSNIETIHKNIDFSEELISKMSYDYKPYIKNKTKNETVNNNLEIYNENLSRYKKNQYEQILENINKIQEISNQHQYLLETHNTNLKLLETNVITINSKIINNKSKIDNLL